MSSIYLVQLQFNLFAPLPSHYSTAGDDWLGMLWFECDGCRRSRGAVVDLFEVVLLFDATFKFRE